jgi:hypothetical protein
MPSKMNFTHPEFHTLVAQPYANESAKITSAHIIATGDEVATLTWVMHSRFQFAQLRVPLRIAQNLDQVEHVAVSSSAHVDASTT